MTKGALVLAALAALLTAGAALLSCAGLNRTSTTGAGMAANKMGAPSASTVETSAPVLLRVEHGSNGERRYWRGAELVLVADPLEPFQGADAPKE